MSDQNPYPDPSPYPDQNPGAGQGPYPGQGAPPPWQRDPVQPPSYSYDEAPTSEERTWALLAHIGTLVSAWFALGLLAPLITLLVKGGSSPFVRRHSIESLNFQISLLIYGVVAAIVSLVLTLVTFGLALLVIIPAAAVIAVTLLVFVVLATMRASNGEDYRYPLTLRLVS